MVARLKQNPLLWLPNSNSSHLFFGGLILLLAVDWVDSLLKGSGWGMRPVLLLQYGALFAAFATGLVSGRRSVQLAAAVIAFAVQLFYIFQELGVLGSW